MTNEAVIVFHGSNPNESKSWSRDGISDSDINNAEELFRLWLWLDILFSCLDFG